VIFWPAAFFLGGDEQSASALGQMKGQMVAVEQASIAKSVGSSFSALRAPDARPSRATFAFILTALDCVH
jgi:hypothetical protein